MNDMKAFENILSQIADNTQPNRDKSDYIGDKGLLYCGKCNTPKQVEITICGQIKRPYCMCKCEETAYAQEQERLKAVQRREEIERNRAAISLDADKIGRASCRERV